MESYEVSDVTVERDKQVTVTFSDGHECRWVLQELRKGCPCATCRSFTERGQEAWPRGADPAKLRIVDASLVGNWGLGITWNDGHSTGIFAWEILRRWCDARDAALAELAHDPLDHPDP